MDLDVFEGGRVEESGEGECCDLFPFVGVMCFEKLNYVAAVCECEVSGAVFFDAYLLHCFLKGFTIGFGESFRDYSAQVTFGNFL